VRVEIPVVKAEDDETHWLSVEVEDDVATFYLDNVELFATDFENVEDLMTAVGLIWGGWQKTGEAAKNE